MICRNCHQETGDEVLVDLGMQPLANSLVNAKNASAPVYPLAPVICKNGHCGLIQLPELPGGVGFGKDYPYRSGQSESWKLHLRDLVERAGVRAGDEVWDIGGNDGSMEAVVPHGAKYVNLDPSTRGPLPLIQHAMTREYGECVGPVADYVFALNVAAHVPDLDDFFAGIRAIMKDDGLLTVEVQDVEQMIVKGAWDCIYHEHYSYFSYLSLNDALERRGFFVEKIERISTHGGSLRAYARKNLLADHPLHRNPMRIMRPLAANVRDRYPDRPEMDGLSRQTELMAKWEQEGKRVVGYGAPAKANTWINGHSITNLEYIVDSTPEKIGKYTPASHIEIKSPDVLDTDTPDIIVVLAWNWLSEIRPKLQAHVDRGVEIWCRGERLR